MILIDPAVLQAIEQALVERDIAGTARLAELALQCATSPGPRGVAASLP